jgi:hypothetical protein
MSEYTLVFLGDIVGSPGRAAVHEAIPTLKQRFDPLFMVVNGENSAAGLGITPKIAEEFFSWGIDAITLGNHSFAKREIIPYLDSGKPIIRPYNMPKATPGTGLLRIQKGGIELAIMNISGRVYMDPWYSDPFECADSLLANITTKHRLIDFHAEVTSEKIAMGMYCDGRASVVVGTHTHVQTSDEKILPLGTAYLTDVGMCGPHDSVLGMDKAIILRRFTTGMPERFEVAQEPGSIRGIAVRIDKVSGKALHIERIRGID